MKDFLEKVMLAPREEVRRGCPRYISPLGRPIWRGE